MKKALSLILSVALAGSVMAINCKRNVALQPDGSIKVDLTLDKENINGVARLLENVPQGMSIKYAKSETGNVAFENNQVKFIWMKVPESKEVTVTYTMASTVKPVGKQTINGKFSYVENNQSKSVPLPVTSFLINEKNELTYSTEALLLTAVTYPVDNMAAPARSADSKTVIVKPVYRIQIASTQEKLDDKYFASKYGVNASDVKVEKVNGIYKYMIGNFSTLNEASKFKNMLVAKGVNDAFVAPYLNDTRISIAEAQKLEVSNK